jgi:ceramide kinase
MVRSCSEKSESCRRYEAEVSFLDIPHSLSSPHGVVPQGPWTHHLPFTNSNSISQENKKAICRVNCATCAKGPDFSHIVSQHSEEGYASNHRLEGLQAPKWQTRRGKFHSVGAAIMSCRNDKAPDGVAAHAHLADGFLHLILIRECSRPAHLRSVFSMPHVPYLAISQEGMYEKKVSEHFVWCVYVTGSISPLPSRICCCKILHS